MFTLKILRSDTGALYEIPVNPNVLISTIKESLATVTNLQPNEQILLAETNLASNRTLESYNILKDKEIFLFNKRILENPNIQPEDVNLTMSEIQLPRLPTPKNLKELETSLNPLNKLFTLEFYFNNYVVGAQYLKDIFENKTLQCINSLSELNIQKKSISAALNSLDDYKNKLLQNQSNFLSVYKKQSPNFEALLMYFEKDLSQLKQIKLHDALKLPNRITLLDCIPEVEIRKWADQCQREYDVLKSKIVEIGHQIENVKLSVELELKKSIDINFSDLNDRLTITREHTRQIQALHQSSISNLDKIKKYLEVSRGSSTNQNQISNVVMSFNEIKVSQDSSLASSIKNVEILMTTLNVFSKAKNYMNYSVFATLRNISKLQAKMHELISSFSIWNEAISKQSTNFFQLECIHHMPTAYEEALTETSRRKKFGNSISSNLNRFLESLNGIRDEENQKRQQFFERVYQYLPPNIFQSLKEQVPNFNIQFTPFDQNLPNLESSLSYSLNNNSKNINNNNSKYILSGTNSGGSGSNEISDDDDFALIDGIDQMSIKKKLEQSNLNKSLMESQTQNEKIKNLELKLQSTFLMASRAEEKYKDLLEKSRVLQSDSVTTEQARKNQIEDVKKELEEKKLELSKLSSDGAMNLKRLESLQENERELQQKIRELELERSLSRKQIGDLENNIKMVENEKSLFEQSKTLEIESFNQSIQSLDKQKLDLLEEIKDLKSQITRHEQFIEISNSSTIDTNEQHSKLMLEKQTTINTLQNKVLQLESDLEVKQASLVSLQDQQRASEKSSRDLTNRNDELEESINVIKSKLSANSEKYEMDIQTLNSQLSQLVNEKGVLETELVAARIGMEQVKQQLRSVDDELSSVKKVLEMKSSEGDESMERVIALTNDIDRLKEKVMVSEHLKEKLEKELEEANDTIRSKDTIISIVQNQMNELTNDAKQKDEIISSSELQLKDNDMTIKDLTTRLNKITEERDSFKANHSSSQIQEDSLKNTIDQLESLVQQLKSKVTQKDEEIVKMKDEMASQNQAYLHEKMSLKNELKQKSETLTNYSNQLSKYTNENATITKQSQEKDTVIVELKSKIEQLTEKLEQLEKSSSSESQSIQIQLIDLKDLLQVKEVEISNYQLTMNQKTNRISELEKQYELTNVNYVNSLHQNEKLQESNNEKEQLCNTLALDLEKREQELREKEQLCNTLAIDLEKREQDFQNTEDELNKVKLAVKQISTALIGHPVDIVSTNDLLRSISDQKALEKSLEEQNKYIKSLESLSVEILNNNNHEDTAILSNFRHSRVAIFNYIKPNVYEAVNINAPHYYLSPDCIESFRDEVSKKALIIGTIIEVKKSTADGSNPYGLANGTEYHELLVGNI